MNVIWWFDSIELWMHHHWIINWRKRRKKIVWTRRKDDEKNKMLCHWCFWFTTNAPMCEAWKTGVCTDKKGVMVEEWKARRKEWKKKRWKKGEGKKWFWEMSFLFLFDCVFCVFPFFFTLHSPRHNTRSHTHHTPYVKTHWCTPSHANRAVCCAAFLGVDSKTHSIIHTPHSITWHHTTHQPTQHKHNSLCKRQRDDNCQWEGDWTKGKSGTTQQHQHTDWSGNNTMALKHTALWLTTERWVDVAWHWQWQSVWHKATTLTSTPSNHQTPTLSSLIHSQTQTPCLLPIPQLPTPLFCTLCACHIAATTHHLIVGRKKEEGLRVCGRKGVAHLSGFFEVTQNHSTLLNNHPHTERQRERNEKTDTAIPRGKHHFSSDQWS